VSDFGLIRLRYLTPVWFVVIWIERRVDGYRGLGVDTVLGDGDTRRKLWYHPVGSHRTRVDHIWSRLLYFHRARYDS
jgi:hypothetical protein